MKITSILLSFFLGIFLLGSNAFSKPNYNPAGKEIFVLHKLPVYKQKGGYEKFCHDTSTSYCKNKLNYSEYVGMKGYFDTSEPAHKDYSDNQFWPVILENGDKFYFVVSGKRGRKYGTSQIIPLKIHLELSNFKPSPIVKGSSINVISRKVSHGREIVKLDNGKEMWRKNLILIQEVAKRFGDNVKIADLLVNFSISKDEMEGSYFISPLLEPVKNGIRLYIGVNDKSAWLRMKVRYYGDSWLFVKSFKIAADNYRYQSPVMEFERDNASGSVWEWLDKSATKKDVEIARQLAGASKATVRFQGRQYNKDELMNESEKKALTEILTLYELIK